MRRRNVVHFYLIIDIRLTVVRYHSGGTSPSIQAISAPFPLNGFNFIPLNPCEQQAAEPFQLGEEVVHVSVSIGITLYPNDATEIDNLFRNADQAMFAKAPPCNEVMRQFHDFIGDTPLVAHNAAFDRKFLDAELSLIGLQARQPMICSMRIARRVFQDAPNHKLGTLVRYAHIEADGVFHRALADAEKTAKLMLKMASHLHESHGLHTVNLELMQRLESTAKAQVANQLRCWNS